MKRIYNYSKSLLVLLLVILSSCMEDYNNPSEGNVPLAADIDAEVMVNQETNEATFSLKNTGNYPVWIFTEASGKSYSTVNGLKKVYRKAGTYTVEVKLANSNGISDGSVIKTFVVENTLLNENPGGYDANNDCNLWKPATFTNEFYYAPGWSQIANPGFSADGNLYSINLPAATTDTWQAQVKFLTSMTTSAANNYDFSAVFLSNKNHGNVTVKLVQTGDDGNFYFEQKISLVADQDFVFIKTNMPGKDMANVSLVLDFGGNAADTEVLLRRVTLKQHDCDDGTEIEEPVDDTVNWLPNSDCNLWKNVAYVNHFFYAPGWAAIYEGPAYTGFTAGNNSYTLTYPTATSDQWQNQVHFRTTNVSTTADKSYDFRVLFTSNNNINNVTIKLTKVGDDATFFFTERVNLVAGQEYTFKMAAMEGKDIDNISLVFDFAGNPADTEITISSIILKESTCNN
jgi:hypothetical protein